MIERPLSVLAAVATFGTGAAITIGIVPIELSEAVVLLTGFVLFMAAVWSIAMRQGTKTAASTPTPELPQRVPIPGETLSDAIGQFRSWSPEYVTAGRQTIEGLEGAALSVMTRFQGLTEATATDRIHSGEWTDDPYVMALLSDAYALPTPTDWRTRLASVVERLPLHTVRNSLLRRVEGESAYDIAVRRASTELASISREAMGGGVQATTATTRTIDERDPRTTSKPVEGTYEADLVRTAYWRGIGVVALLSVAVGLYAQTPAVVLGGAVGMGFAGASGLLEAPAPELGIDRSLSTTTPDPGDEVAVTVTITNESGSTVPDLRFVDGVPSGLSVESGPARLGTALRPGQSVTFEYAVTASRGRYRFDPAYVLTRDPFQATERTLFVASDTELRCQPPTDPLTAPIPLRPTANTFGSTIETGESGAGTAFHSVREYRKGDPLNRVDWNRYARTGDLATLEFDEERAASVLLLIDARRDAYVAPGRGERHAVDRSVTACSRLAASLREAGNHVGLAAIGMTARSDAPEADGSTCWVSPGAGRSHLDRIHETLRSHPQLSTTPPTTTVRWTTQLRRIRNRLPAATQVLYCTPLSDDTAVAVARRLEAHGHPVTVVSPDATTVETTSEQLAAVARRIRRFDLQRAGIPVVDWRAGESIDSALTRPTLGAGA